MQTVAMALRARGVRDEDLTSLLSIWRAAVAASHGFLTSEDVDWYEKLVVGYLQQMGDLRVAVDVENAPLGFIAQDAGEIHILFVSPAAASVRAHLKVGEGSDPLTVAAATA